MVAGAGAAGADDRGDELLWTPLEWRAGAAPESGADAGGADVDVFLERMGVRELKRPAPLDGAPAGAPSQPLSTGGSANPAGAGTAGSQGSAAAGPPAALVEGDSVCVGGLSQERCLHALLQSKYDAGAAAAALGAEEPALVVWNKVRGAAGARHATQGAPLGLAPHPALHRARPPSAPRACSRRCASST